MVSKTTYMVVCMLSNIMSIRRVEFHCGHCCRSMIAVAGEHIIESKSKSGQHLHGDRG